MLNFAKFRKYILFVIVLIAITQLGFAMESEILDFKSVQVTRLVTDEDHKNFLIKTLNSAKKSMMRIILSIMQMNF